MKTTKLILLLKNKMNFARIRAPKSSAFLLGTAFFVCAPQEAVSDWDLRQFLPDVEKKT